MRRQKKPVAGTGGLPVSAVFEGNDEDYYPGVFECLHLTFRQYAEGLGSPLGEDTTLADHMVWKFTGDDGIVYVGIQNQTSSDNTFQDGDKVSTRFIEAGAYHDTMSELHMVFFHHPEIR